MKDGYEFVEGDIFINSLGELNVLTSNETWISNLNNLEASKLNGERYILHAAALEEKKTFMQTGEEYEHTKTLNFIYERLIEVHGENPSFDYMHKLKNVIIMVEDRESPCNKAAALDGRDNVPSLHESYPNEDAFAGVKKPRTKVEYEHVNANDDAFWEVAREFAEDCVEFRSSQDNCKINDNLMLLTHYSNRSLQRRIETTITEREAFVDWFESIHEVYIGSEEYDHGQLGEFLFDNGCKLVN